MLSRLLVQVNFRSQLRDFFSLMQVLKDTLLQHFLMPNYMSEPDSSPPERSQQTILEAIRAGDRIWNNTEREIREIREAHQQSIGAPNAVRVRPPKRPRSPTPCREGCVCLGGNNLRQHHCCGGQNSCCKGGGHLGPHYCRLCLVSAVVEHCRQGQALLALQLQKDLGHCVDGNCCFGPRSCFEPPGQ